MSAATSIDDLSIPNPRPNSDLVKLGQWIKGLPNDLKLFDKYVNQASIIELTQQISYLIRTKTISLEELDNQVNKYSNKLSPISYNKLTSIITNIYTSEKSSTVVFKLNQTIQTQNQEMDQLRNRITEVEKSNAELKIIGVVGGAALVGLTIGVAAVLCPPVGLALANAAKGGALTLGTKATVAAAAVKTVGVVAVAKGAAAGVIAGGATGIGGVLVQEGVNAAREKKGWIQLLQKKA